MNVAELDRLAGGRAPDGMDYEEAITYLARRVIAAEKLAEAVRYDLSCWPDTMAGTLRDVLQAYEATK